MNARKLTEAAMLSALFVVTSMMAIYTGIAYTLYLDMIVPYISCEEAFSFIDILMDATEKYSKVINPSIYFASEISPAA